MADTVGSGCGGARPGAGRPRGGGVTRAQVKIAVETAGRLGLMPIEVLLTQMIYSQKQWEAAKNDLETGRGPDEFLEMRREQMKYFFTFAHECAIAASPFLHGRVASVAAEACARDPIKVRHQIEQLERLLDERAAAKAQVIDAEPVIKRVLPEIKKVNN